MRLPIWADCAPRVLWFMRHSTPKIGSESLSFADRDVTAFVPPLGMRRFG
jgi:hypothetical protein